MRAAERHNVPVLKPRDTVKEELQMIVPLIHHNGNTGAWWDATIIEVLPQWVWWMVDLKGGVS